MDLRLKQNKTIAIFSKINKDTKTRTREVIVLLYIGQCVIQDLFGVEDIKRMKLMVSSRKAKQTH